MKPHTVKFPAHFTRLGSMRKDTCNKKTGGKMSTFRENEFD